MKLVEKIDYAKIVSIILDSSERVFLSMPGIHDEVAEALIRKSREINIKVLIDNSEDTIRNGMGDVEGIEKLLQNQIEVLQSDGNMISFIIFDNEGYFLFPQSKIFLQDPVGSNAFKLDPLTIKLLVDEFFSLNDKIKFEDDFDKTALLGDTLQYLRDRLEGSSIQEKHFVINFKRDKFDEIRENLAKNPPLTPDLQRRIKIYNSIIQFVEFRFIGGNIEDRIIRFPSKVLPFENEELKSLLRTRIKMFQHLTSDKDFSGFIRFKERIEELRKKYLNSLSCRPGKSILKIKDKEEFGREVKKLMAEIQDFDNKLPELLERHLMKTRKIIEEEFTNLFKRNGAPEFAFIKDPDLKLEKMQFEARKIVSSIKFPNVKDLLNKMSFDVFYYDLTWNDFKDEQLLDELKNRGVIKSKMADEIRDLKDAYEAI